MANETTSKRKRRRSKGKRHWIILVTAANLAFVLVIYLSHVYLAELAWWSMFLTYVPQFLFLLPSAIFAAAFGWRRKWAPFAANTLIGVLGLWLVAGMVWNPLVRPSGKPRMRIMTFNIHGGKQGFDKVAQLVLDQNPDVLCLQEAGNIRAGRLPEKLPMYHFRFNGSLAIASKLPILEERVFALPPGQEALTVKVKHARGIVQVVDVHLVPTNIQHDVKHGEKALAVSMERTATAHASQVRKLLEEALPVPSELVLCGDFNAPPFGIQYGRLTQFLTDAYAASGSGFGYTVPAVFPFIRIDFVFCNEKLRPVGAWVPSAIASDHRPTVAEVEWR